jgi:hypothetical protein
LTKCFTHFKILHNLQNFSILIESSVGTKPREYGNSATKTGDQCQTRIHRDHVHASSFTTKQVHELLDFCTFQEKRRMRRLEIAVNGFQKQPATKT